MPRSSPSIRMVVVWAGVQVGDGHFERWNICWGSICAARRGVGWRAIDGTSGSNAYELPGLLQGYAQNR